MDRRTLLLAGPAAALAACGGSSSAPSPAPPPVARGNRQLGLVVNDGGIGFAAAFAEARSAGIQFVTLPQPWDDIERSPGVFSNTYLDAANAFYPPNNTRVVLEFNPIDTNVVRLPADLRGRAYDDPTVISRYAAAFDYVLSRLPNISLSGVVIGNEIDATLGSNAALWAQYARFFQAAAAHVRMRRPGVAVGTKAQFDSIGSANLATVNASADAWMLTYYPMLGNFQVRNPGMVPQDVGAMVQAAQGKPIFLLEAGYPSATLNGSSPDLQAQFVRQLFAAWDSYPTQLPLVNFLWMHDISTAELNALLAYYGTTAPAFAAFLGSLGLRSFNGVNKPGFDALRAEARARGW